MSEITTKLPYVAGYNVKMAFVIQDLKNLDEIYGETSRHSLMGNCGYQLVFGANDQVTAEAVSKGLGKRTVRYKTESRTIEVMGLHRRTKVEQLRERDLMMPQEVRQMPGDKMVILAEGQGPVFADKLRFFRTAPFREMERFSQAHLPDVPATEFLPQARTGNNSCLCWRGHEYPKLSPWCPHRQGSVPVENFPVGPNPLMLATGAKQERSRRPRHSCEQAAAKATSVHSMLVSQSRPETEGSYQGAGQVRNQRKARSWARVFDETIPTNGDRRGQGELTLPLSSRSVSRAKHAVLGE